MLVGLLWGATLGYSKCIEDRVDGKLNEWRVGRLSDLQSSLPTAETCVRGKTGYEWHYGSPMSPITASLHLGFGLNRHRYTQGSIALTSALFHKFRVSLSTSLPGQNASRTEKSLMSSPLRSV